MLAITLDSEIERRLEALGATTESTKAAMAREALLEALDDQLDLRTAQERAANPGRIWTLEEIERGDDLEG